MDVCVKSFNLLIFLCLPIVLPSIMPKTNQLTLFLCLWLDFVRWIIDPFHTTPVSICCLFGFTHIKCFHTMAFPLSVYHHWIAATTHIHLRRLGVFIMVWWVLGLFNACLWLILVEQRATNQTKWWWWWWTWKTENQCFALPITKN